MKSNMLPAVTTGGADAGTYGAFAPGPTSVMYCWDFTNSCGNADTIPPEIILAGRDSIPRIPMIAAPVIGATPLIAPVTMSPSALCWYPVRIFAVKGALWFPASEYTANRLSGVSPMYDWIPLDPMILVPCRHA